jgi:isoprenylcysteine carboxyl methyltransferase (ICMT) family protein YpbQ
MLEKGFLRNQGNESGKHHQIALIVSKTLLYLGVVILVGAFGYLLFNWGKNDMLIGMLLPFLVAGLGLIFVSRLILRAYTKLRR